MNNINPINAAQPATNIQATQEGTRTPIADESQLVDRVEISELAKSLNERGLDTNDIRVDKVLAIREAIANNTYITAEKVDLTIDRLIEVLRSTEHVQ